MDNLDASPEQVYKLQKVFVLVTAVPYFVLVWDWLTNLSKEYSLIRRRNSSNGTQTGGGVGILSIRNAFIASRYITIIWCTFVVVVLGNVDRHPSLCSWSKYFPYGYSTTMLFAHFVMVLRMYSIYERSKRILIFLLSLTALDYALQMSANHAATSIFLLSQNPHLSICFTVPTTLLYSLVFISPTIFHHIVLVMTLYKSIQHIRATRAGGIYSIMNVVQRDQILFVLAICLINFSNLVLVLQGSSWPYRLINQLPAAAFTQIFLSKIIFNLKHVQKKLASANVSPVITTLALSPSSRRGEFNFGESNYCNDLELGEDFKLSSSGSPPNSNNPTEDDKLNRKEFLAGTASARKEKIFTLKFDPISNKRRYHHNTSSTFSPDIVSKNDRSTFRVEQDKIESHDLSSYRLPSPRTIDSDEIKPSYAGVYSNLERNPSPTSPVVGVVLPNQLAKHEHTPSSGSNTKMELSPYFGMALSGDEGIETPMPQSIPDNSTKPPSASQQSTVNHSHIEPSLHVETKVNEDVGTAARQSIDSTNRRASTIDDQQRYMDWEAPTAWGTTQSRAASPIPFSERRLSNSVARNSLSLQRSRHTSFGSRKGAIISRSSLDGNASSSAALNDSNSPASGGSNKTSSAIPVFTRGSEHHRGSACYASVFSFDNDGRHEEEEAEVKEEEEESQPIPRDVNGK